MTLTGDMISRFGESVTMTRYSAGSYVNGRYVEGSSVIATIVMSVQPVLGEELMNLPEAQRTKVHYKGYTEESLITSDQPTGRRADIITVAGKDYEVQTVERWKYDMRFFKVMLAGINP